MMTENKKTTKAGRKPLSKKPKPAGMNYEDVFGNPFKLDEDLISEIKDKGLEYRFICEDQLRKNSNRHNRKWVPYRREQSAASSTTINDFMHGSSPDGYIRAGSNVLAVRPKEIGDMHREFLRQKRERANRVDENKYEELRKSAKGLAVQQGYDEGD